MAFPLFWQSHFSRVTQPPRQFPDRILLGVSLLALASLKLVVPESH